jgi:hypothetical protein
MIKSNIAFGKTDMLSEFLLRFGLVYPLKETNDKLDVLVRDVDLILAQNKDAEEKPNIMILLDKMSKKGKKAKSKKKKKKENVKDKTKPVLIKTNKHE